jgi:hypothetical protein
VSRDQSNRSLRQYSRISRPEPLLFLPSSSSVLLTRPSKSCRGVFLLSVLEFGKDYGLLSSVSTRVRSLVCAVFDWERYRLSMLDVEAVPQSCIYEFWMDRNVCSYSPGRRHSAKLFMYEGCDM